MGHVGQGRPALHARYTWWLDRAVKRPRAVLISGGYRVVDHESPAALGWGTARATTHGTRTQGKSGEHMMSDAATLDQSKPQRLGPVFGLVC